MLNVYFQPPPSQFPPKGGVATHLRQLHKYLSQQVNLVSHPDEADLLHVESSWPIPKTIYRKKLIYVCHGGFLPSAIPTVIQNLQQADIIISVSKWICDRFFPQHRKKTVVIPNGVDLPVGIKDSPYKPGYFLYAKEWKYHFEDFEFLVYNSPNHYFLSTVWEGSSLPSNLDFVGLQSFDKMQSILKDASALILTGSEVCPTMLLEAWSLRVPVIARNIDGSKEIMSIDNATVGGLLYNTKNEMIVGLDYVMVNREHLGERGYQEVVKKYQWKNLVSKYLEVYNR